MEDLFDKDFIESLGYTVIRDDGVYGEAHSKIPKGKKILQWNRNGTTINYFGETEEYAQFFGISDDGGSRNTFNGKVRTREQVALIISLTI